MHGTLAFRWLGTAGIELSTADQVLIIDPYFSRVPVRKLLLGGLQPERALIEACVERCDFVLITHAHFDHLMDVPEVLANTGAMAFGTANSCRLLRFCGAPSENVSEIRAGDHFTLGGFQIEARVAQHVKLPGFGSRPLAPDLKGPLRARDYVMDTHTSYRISANGFRLLTDPGVAVQDAGAADVLFVSPGLRRPYYERLLGRVQPQLVVPIHWDDFFRPLSEPVQPFWKHPRWSWPPLERVNLAAFQEMIQHLAPETSVLVPEALRVYRLRDLL